MVDAQPAAVRPRVTLDDGDVALVLEDEVQALLEARETGLIEILGVPGSGKSTALAHLAHVFAGDGHLILADRPSEGEVFSLIKAARRQLVVCASAGRLPADTRHWWLAPWTQDEYIEYLLGTHRERCAAVLARIAADPARARIVGLPELWHAVLDRLAADHRLVGVNSALRQEAYLRLPSPEARNAARECCWISICQPELAGSALADLWHNAADDRACRLLRHVEVQMLLAGEHLAGHLFADPQPTLLEQRIPESLVRETAALVSENTQVLARLREILDGEQESQQAMATSLLCAAGDDCRPRAGHAPKLSGAYLAGVRWPQACLKQIDLSEADLTRADLSGAELESVFAYGAHFDGARLRGARLKMFSADTATLAGADLSGVHAAEADFGATDLSDANLEEANFSGAKFAAASFSGARCCRANMSHADLTYATIDGADFTGVDFERAILRGLNLRVGEFTAARFPHALMDDCDLEYMRLPAANFYRAQLCGAHFTGSQMPGASFRGADLQYAGLAEIDWERADLRDADLRRSTFHLGSSRSGLVGSPIACEGSRTGFYTDDYQDQEFKSPEEIRKANLRGADLRGANVSRVDFYLVDLRDALYSHEQEDHFRRCGAILEARVR